MIKPINPKRYAREPYWLTKPAPYRARVNQYLGWLCLLACGVILGGIIAACLGLI